MSKPRYIRFKHFSSDRGNGGIDPVQRLRELAQEVRRMKKRRLILAVALLLGLFPITVHLVSNYGSSQKSQLRR